MLGTCSSGGDAPSARHGRNGRVCRLQAAGLYTGWTACSCLPPVPSVLYRGARCTVAAASRPLGSRLKGPALELDHCARADLTISRESTSGPSGSPGLALLSPAGPC